MKNWEEHFKIALRSVAASCPVASSVSAAWNEYESRLQFQRIDDTIESILEMLRKHGESIGDLDDRIKRSEELPTLTEIAISRSKFEVDRDKRRAWGQALATLVSIGDMRTTGEKVLILESLERLATKDLALLEQYETYGARKLQNFLNYRSYQYNISYREASYMALAIQKLIARGLLTDSEANAALESTSPWEGAPRMVQNLLHVWNEITPIGRDVLAAWKGKLEQFDALNRVG